MKAGTVFPPTLPDVEAVVVGHYHISVEELLQDSRGGRYGHQRAEIEPRYVAWWLARTMTTASPYKVSEYFKRHEQSINWGMRKVELLRKESPGFNAKLAELAYLIRLEARTIPPIWSRLQMNHPAGSAVKWEPDAGAASNQDCNQVDQGDEQNNHPDALLNHLGDGIDETLNHPDGQVDNPGQDNQPNEKPEDTDSDLGHVAALQGSTR